MTNIKRLKGYAFAKKKGDDIYVFEEGQQTLGDSTPVIAEGTDAPRVLKNRFADVVNVKDFGAVGDGVTDDTNAIQAALNTGRSVHIPSGVYVCSSELYVINSGQRIVGDGMGSGYEAPYTPEEIDVDGNVISTDPKTIVTDWVDNTTLLFIGTGEKQVRTRYRHRASASDPQDDSLSVCLNIQADSVRLEDFCIRLKVEVSGRRYDDSIDNLGADWDIGLFIGSRGQFSSENVAVIGYARKANIWLDSTQAQNLPRFSSPTGEEYPVSNICNGADYFNLTRVITSGGLWGLFIQGVKLADGHDSRDVPYYDEILGKAVPDYRGSFGTSDLCFTNCQFFGANHHSMRRFVNMPSDKNPLTSAYVGGSFYIDGYAPNQYGAIHGHRYISCRFQSHSPFCVYLGRTARDLFLGCMIENPTGAERDHDTGEEIAVSAETNFGGLYASPQHKKLRVIGSYAPFYYTYSTVNQNDVFMAGDRPEDQPVYLGSSASVYLTHLLEEGKNARAFVLSPDDGNSGIGLGTDTNPYREAIYAFRDEGLSHFRLGSTLAKLDGDKMEGGVYRNRVLDIVCAPNSVTTITSPQGTNYVHYGAVGFFTGTDGSKDVLTLYNGGTVETGGPVRANTDNSYACGMPEYRWANIYAASGSINTSDSRVKSSISLASDTLLDAVGAIPIHTFQFRDAVEKKGADVARFHAGVIAQEVKSAFEDKGLDAARYGLFCYDEWEDGYKDFEVVDQEDILDEEGNVLQPRKSHLERRHVLEAGNRYGIRYEELLILEAAYQRRRADRLEERLSKLEKEFASRVLL